MIEAGLEFDSHDADRVAAALIALPPALQPVHFSHEEHVVRADDLVADHRRLSTFIAKSQSGFFLLGQGITYSIRVAAGRSLICDGFMNIEPELAKQFLIRMAAAHPIFGFACSPDERKHRNRVTTQLGINKTESWVGRDTAKYVPGLYWLTLLSDALMRKHRVPLSALTPVARETIALEAGQRLFRFYDRPEEWQGTPAISHLCASLPGVFDVEIVKPKLRTAKSLIELSSLLQNWK